MYTGSLFKTFPGQEMETILANMVKPRLYLKYKKLAGCGDTPVVPATWETKAAESLEPRIQRLQ